MSRNEIKLRREQLSAGDIGRYRNYSALMQRHERNRKFKRVVRLFTYSILVTVFILLTTVLAYYILSRMGR